MSYCKKIVSYIDYYEKSERKKNIGFVKINIKNDECDLHIQVRGLPSTDTMSCRIKDKTGEKEIGVLELTAGQGSYHKRFTTEKIGESGISFAEFSGVILPFSASRMGTASWDCGIGDNHEVVSKPANTTKPVSRPEVRVEEKTEIKEELPVLQMEEKQPVPEKQTEKSAPEIPAEEKSGNSATDRKWEKSDAVCEDKWQQLCRLYPRIKPFEPKEMEEEGEYLSIAPKDFIVLREQYQHLVNNSFLLHGYYNYRHILLGKKRENGKYCYYVGVPGNFYTREKMVAVMFGFEAFENAVEADTMIQGSFGYYLCRVDI